MMLHFKRRRNAVRRFMGFVLVTALLMGILPAASLPVFAGEYDSGKSQVHVVVENTTFTEETNGDMPPWTGQLVDTWIELSDISTMMSCVVDALTEAGYEQEGAENGYISSIDGLGEFAGSYMSGWMGSINDWFTNYGFSEFTCDNGTLNDGDEIRIMFSLDYGEDLGSSWYNNYKTLDNIEFSAGALTSEFNSDTYSYTLNVPAGTESVKVVPTATNRNFQVRVYSSAAEEDYLKWDNDNATPQAISADRGLFDSGYKRTEDVALNTEGDTVIKVVCGKPEWPSMNNQAGGTGGDEEACIYTITVCQQAETVSVNGVSLDKDTMTVNIGFQESLTATVSPENASNKEIIWTSTDEMVATVSAIGEVTGLKAGTATVSAITADGNYAAECTVSVVQPDYLVWGVSKTGALVNIPIVELKSCPYVTVPNDYKEIHVQYFKKGVYSEMSAYQGTCSIKSGEGYQVVQRKDSDLAGLTIPMTLLIQKALNAADPDGIYEEWPTNYLGTKASNIKLIVFWEPSDYMPEEIWSDGGSIYSPYRLNSANYTMVGGKGGVGAEFCFKIDAEEVSLWNSDYSEKLSVVDETQDTYKISVDPDSTVYVQINGKDEDLTFSVDCIKRESTDGPDDVVEFLPMVGQFTNQSSFGTLPERTLAGKNAGGAGTGTNIISLGNFGGYIVYKFNEPVLNSNKHPYGVDFYINGNSLGGAGFSEPGNVMVSQDGETWYTLAGSAHYDANAIWNYTLNYTKKDSGVDWTDNLGNSGNVSLNYALKKNYTKVSWTEAMETSMTVSGILLVENGTDSYGSNNAAYPDWGYVDTGYSKNPYSAEVNGGESFDISWAVDENGYPVHLDSISYVKVQSASNIVNPSLGEKSTEVSSIGRYTENESAVGNTVVTAVTLNGISLDIESGKEIFGGLSASGNTISVSAEGDTVVYINGTKTSAQNFDAMPPHGIVRIVVQKGEKLPYICYLISDEAYAPYAVIDAINEIGAVSLDSKDVIDAARALYDALLADKKSSVSNYDVLTSAETEYARLLAEKEAREAAERAAREAAERAAAERQRVEDNKQLVSSYVNKLVAQMTVNVSQPAFGTSNGEWTVLSVARSGYYNSQSQYFEDYYNRIVETVKTKVASVNVASATNALDKNKSTENSRLIVALSAIGRDAKDVGGYDLTAPYSNFTWVKKQGINGPIWTLIALDSMDYSCSDATIRQQCIDFILGKELAGGGWALSGSSADPDITSMALQALAPYASQSAVKAAADRAIAKLSSIQNSNGAFVSWGAENSESCAQVIVALCAWGINPDSDSRFIKDGVSALENLLSYYVEDEQFGAGFAHVLSSSGGYEGGAWNSMATDQGTYALVALDRLNNSKTSLYDMSDVTMYQKPSDSNTESVSKEKKESVSEKLEVGISVNKDGSVNAEIDEKNLNNVIDKMKSDSDGGAAPQLVLDVQVSDSANINIPVNALSKLEDIDDSEVVIKLKQGELSIDHETLKSVLKQCNGGELTVDVSLKTFDDVKDSVTDAIKNNMSADVDEEDLKNAAVLEVSFKSGDKTISQFDGNAVEVAVPVGESHENGKCYLVLVISADNSVEKLIATVAGGKAIVSMPHFSTIVVTTEEASPFIDVNIGDSFYKTVMTVYEKGLMRGVGQNLFDPQGDLSRAMMVQILYNLDGNHTSSGNIPFEDVKSGSWYEEAIKWAYEKKIIYGTDATHFCPNECITSEQMACMLYRYAAYKKYNVSKSESLNSYADANMIHDWALDAMKWSYAEDIISCRTKDVLAPMEHVTRCEAAEAIAKFVELF